MHMYTRDDLSEINVSLLLAYFQGFVSEMEPHFNTFALDYMWATVATDKVGIFLA